MAVDPPAGGEVARNASARGIIVAARGGDVVYVLADRSVQGLSPSGWARQVAGAVAEFVADAIVAVASQGGDMVRTVLEQADQLCPIRLVRAAQSKRARAQPADGYYENSRVRHCGRFPDLEDQLIALGQGEGGGHDRADARVWALDQLMRDASAIAPRVRVLGA